MPLLRVNLMADGPRIAGTRDPAGHLRRALRDLPPGAPVIALIHGYKFSPASLAHTPHRHILSLRPGRRGGRVVSWPRHMGFDRGSPAEGLCLAIGWEGRGTIWQAHGEAGRAGGRLAQLLRDAGTASSGGVGVLAHSLGARVALSALPQLPEGTLRRLVLLSGAEFGEAAAAAMASPGGRSAEVINVTSRENMVFDLMFERLLQPPWHAGRALGAGLRTPGWRDLAIDCPETRAALAARGFRIPPPARRVCHWSGYLRAGLFPLYAHLLRGGDAAFLDRVNAAIRPVPAAPHGRGAPEAGRAVSASA